MISATDLKGGTSFQIDGKPFQVIKYEHKKMGRGGATIKVSVRNLETGQLGEHSFTPNNKFEEINTIKKQLQYLYSDGNVATFMDPDSYSQHEVNLDVIGDAIHFIKEGSKVDVLFWEDRPLSVEIAPKVILEVTQTEKGVKGNSATNVFKPATLENGLEIKVPLFIKVGDKIKVDTRESTYVERVNE